VQANTRYLGLRWNIELDTSWTYGQVWEAVREVWNEELKKRSTSTHPEKHGPMTKVKARDEQNRKTTFAVHEGWTYELIEVDWQGPEWASKLEYKPQPRPAKPEVEILGGLQLEDGMRP
jgi:hypothetical protein